jgi:predicted esterase
MLGLACFGQTPLPVPWISITPVVDGRLDPALGGLPPVNLNPEQGLSGQVTLRCAADAEALYLHLRSAQATLACRDRAYQNGDGLILVLATPTPGAAPTRRFRVMGFSPQPESQRNWQYAFTWYRDVDLQMTPLAGAEFAWHQTEGALEFEVRIPWTALAPYHPLLTPELGLNACFVRAEGEGRRFFTLVEDPGIGSEQRPRAYRPIRFEAPPANLTRPAWFARPAKGHLEAGSPLELEVGSPTALALKVRILEGEGVPVGGSLRQLMVPASATPQRLNLAGGPLPPGGYQVELQGPGRTLRWGLTVLPAGGLASLQQKLARLSPSLAPGTRSTLEFRLQEAERQLAGMAPTDPAPALRRTLTQMERDLLALQEGRDPIAAQRGLLRRAYRSALDQSLQPYSLRVPERLDPKGRHPLLVYLHGSGQDDQGVLDLRRAPEGWLELAPFGRGTSNCFSADHAQEDLREAIADVLAHYPVDPSRIVLAGFSMGGYGVYRTAFERPGFFKGLAIFSGVPDVATRWLGPGHPDFLDPATLAAFKGMPIFIFHGTQDRNCPFEKTERLVGLLRSAGAQVEFVTEAGKGHEYPAPETITRYLAWLDRWSRPAPGP